MFGVLIMLKLENISKYYHSGNNIVLALRKINLELRIGEFVAITGESGSGKSTLLNVLSGLDTYEEGKLFIDGKDVSLYTVEELEGYRKNFIGFIFQDYNIIDNYTVYQNVELALTFQGYSKVEKKTKILEILDKVGLTDKIDQKASKLSGGEKQRTVIARTLAKDCQILVCDEPTGNLDAESGKQILELLHSLSIDKLVIVVTHDFEQISEYATRKIRLYDGEVLENTTIIDTSEKVNTLSQKVYTHTFKDLLRISFLNVISVPKKSLFILFILMFLITVSFFTYSNGISEQNRPYSFSTPYFKNPDQSRIIITKYDETKFTEAELKEINELRYVRTVVHNDTVFETQLLNRGIDPIYSLEEFYYFRILSMHALNAFDLKEGVLPSNVNEVVISDRTQYVIGDYIPVTDTYLSRETPGMETNQFTFKVVGIVDHNVRIDDETHTMYFNDAALDLIALSSIYSNSETYFEIEGTSKYHTPTATWVTPDMNSNVYIDTIEHSLINKIVIDNTLDDFNIKTFDMMFFDICREFGYKREIRDDMDAGLCDTGPFIDTHTFKLSAITTFENKQVYFPITIDSLSFQENGYDQTIYMNQTTFLEFFGEEDYQITAIVYDVYEGKQVTEELNELGYNVFYPSQVIEEENAYNILMTNIRILLVIFFTIVGMYSVGYLVLRNIVMSKRKEYLIYRSIGASKKSIRLIIQLEVFYIFFFASLFVLSTIYIIEQYNTPVPAILRYIQLPDYALLFLSIIVVIELMIRSFGRKVFDVNIISELKGIEA